MIKAAKFLIPSILLTFAGTLSAQVCENDACAPCPSCNPCPCPCCPPKDYCANCAQLWPTCGPTWMITPNAGPCVANGADIFITAEFIYWTVRQDQMGFAVTNNRNINPGINPPKGSVTHPDWKLEPGFKVGLGMLFDCDGWDLYANYTWLRTDTKETAEVKERLRLDDIDWAEPSDFAGIGLKSSTAHWRHHFNVIDLELGRNFFISQCLHLRPHYGLKGTWQDQKMIVNDNGLGSGGIANAFITGDYKLCYWGIGIRAGLDSSWHFTRSISLYGDVAATALWEHFDSDIDVQAFHLNKEVTVFDSRSSKFYSFKPVLEFGLGIRWEDWFCCDEYHYSIEAGWEIQWWCGQNQFLVSNVSTGQFIIETRGGDLGLQGLTLKARFDF